MILRFIFSQNTFDVGPMVASQISTTVLKGNILNASIFTKVWGVCVIIYRMSNEDDLGAASNPYGTLLSRSCPVSLRFNFQEDRCDYAQNVKCRDVL